MSYGQLNTWILKGREKDCRGDEKVKAVCYEGDRGADDYGGSFSSRVLAREYVLEARSVSLGCSRVVCPG